MSTDYFAGTLTWERFPLGPQDTCNRTQDVHEQRSAESKVALPPSLCIQLLKCSIQRVWASQCWYFTMLRLTNIWNNIPCNCEVIRQPPQVVPLVSHSVWVHFSQLWVIYESIFLQRQGKGSQCTSWHNTLGSAGWIQRQRP